MREPNNYDFPASFPLFFFCAVKDNTVLKQYIAVNVLFRGLAEGDSFESISQSAAANYISGRKNVSGTWIRAVLACAHEEIVRRMQILQLRSYTQAVSRLATYVREFCPFDESDNLKLIAFSENSSASLDFLADFFVLALKNTSANTRLLTDTEKNVLKAASFDISIKAMLHTDADQLLADTALPEQETCPGSIPNSGHPLSIDVKGLLPLSDPAYFGKFYGYYYAPNQRSADYRSFELEIKENKESLPSATMIYHGNALFPNGEKVIDTHIYTGTPLFSPVSSNISIMMTNDRSEMYFLSYNRQPFRIHHLYFRRGVAITSSTLGTMPPIVINFVLFNAPIPVEKQKYIPGLLSITGVSFTVPKRAADKLRHESELVDSFFHEFGFILDRSCEEHYSIKESMILNATTKWDEIDVVKALLLLKKISTAPTHLAYEDNQAVSALAKNYFLSNK